MSINPDRFETRNGMLLAGLRERHSFAAAQSGIAAQWQTFRALGEIPGRVGASFFGVICGADDTGMEYMCGVEVSSFDALPQAMGRMRVPEQHYAVFTHRGDVSALRSTWQQILEWLDTGPCESAHTPDFEIYPANFGSVDAAPIEIWVGVRS